MYAVRLIDWVDRVANKPKKQRLMKILNFSVNKKINCKERNILGVYNHRGINVYSKGGEGFEYKRPTKKRLVCLAFVYVHNISIKALKIIKDVMCGDRTCGMRNGFVIRLS